MLEKLAALQMTVRIEDLPVLRRAAATAGWSLVDSGERVTTDEGVDKEAIVVIRIPFDPERAAS